MDKYLKPLSQEQAQARAALFTQTKDNLTYQYFLKLSKGDSYEGSGTITFNIQKTSPNFFIDFAGTTVVELIINDKKVETTDSYESLRENRSLKFPETHLQQGKNVVQIKFKNLYANDGCGLHSFVDTDGKQYVYSDCEPYHCNKIFPCFDQPDLKGVLALTLAVPKDWVAIANESVDSTSKLNPKEFLTEEETGNYNLVAFLATPRISSYLYALMAGPYSEVKCKNPYKNIQMSCYSRESLIPYLKDQAEEVFELTIEGIKFYEEFFGYPFPFTKYDSIFCPEYNQGAMENPGAITFNDRYIWKEATTQDRIRTRANTIVHELAHQWFGNLVTMKWWNDLWLNESFADFISHFCLSNIRSKLTRTQLSDIWVQFFSRKGRGYNDDQKRTTHPIAGEVYNTDHAENIFDGITYSKGAATLKQLLHLIGRENFGKAMEHYFKQHEWTNTTLDDFVGSLQKFYHPTNPKYPSNLSDWKGEWLQIAGLNECIPVWDPLDKEKETTITVIQSAARADFPTLRHHKMKIALFEDSGNIYDSIDVVLDNKRETAVVYSGNQKPKALFLNYQDETFIKTMIDQQSLAFLKEKITCIPDELTRAMIWQSMYNMVKDGKLSGYQFIQTVKGAIEKETSDTCLSSIFTYTSASLHYLPSVLKNNYLKPELFEVTLRSLLSTDKAKKNKLILLRENLIMFASHAEESKIDNVCKLIEWFEGKNEALKDIELSISNKWAIIDKIYNYTKLDANQKKSYFEKAAEIDKSDTAEQMRKTCEALLAEGEERKKLWESFFDKDNTTSVHMIGQSMSGYNNSKQTTSDHEKVFFDNLIDVFNNRNNKFASAFYSNLYPKGENLQYYMERTKELMNKASGLDVLIKSLQETLDDLELRRRGYLCATPDFLRVHFNINL